MGIMNSIRRTVLLFFLLMCLGAVAVVYRIVDLQYVSGERWGQQAQQNAIRYAPVEATRGNVLSDNGNMLATSLPYYKVAIDPTVCPDSLFNKGIDSLSMLLSRQFGHKKPAAVKAQLRKARKERKQYVMLSHKAISHQEKRRMERWPIFRLGKRKGGVMFEKQERRFMPYGDLARRTIGFLSHTEQDSVMAGRGVEFAFNRELAGKEGRALFRRMSGNQWKLMDEEGEVNSENGMDVQTTLNVELQQHTTEVLRQGLVKAQADHGCAILMEVATGEIKAIANLKRTADGQYMERYNYALQGLVEPGSTLKLASMMAVLEYDKTLKPTDTVSTGNGKYAFYNDCVMTDAYAAGFGKISVQQVMEKSSNIGISKLVFGAFRHEPRKFIEYLQRFHLKSPLGFQIPGEGAPHIGSPGDMSWSGCSLPWMSIGYELKLTPLQLLAFYNGVANNGRMLEPLIVKRVLKGHKVVQEFQAKVLVPQLCSERTLGYVRTMLEGVVERGTARSIADSTYRIAGKTGTAQKVKVGQYTRSYYTSFAGYFPADNPKYSCIVAVDEPVGDDAYGGRICAPIFKEISDKVYQLMARQALQAQRTVSDIRPPLMAAATPDLQVLQQQLGLQWEDLPESPWARTLPGKGLLRWGAQQWEGRSLPDTRGLPLRDALFLLERLGLKVQAQGRGKVLQQSIAPGTQVSQGTHIALTLG